MWRKKKGNEYEYPYNYAYCLSKVNLTSLVRVAYHVGDERVVHVRAEPKGGIESTFELAGTMNSSMKSMPEHAFQQHYSHKETYLQSQLWKRSTCHKGSKRTKWFNSIHIYIYHYNVALVY